MEPVKGFERVADAEQLAEVVRVMRDEDYDKAACDNGKLAPVSVLAKDLGIGKRHFGRMAAAAGLKPVGVRLIRSGQMREPALLYDVAAAEALRGKTLSLGVLLDTHPASE